MRGLKTTMPAGGGGSGRHRYGHPAMGGEISLDANHLMNGRKTSRTTETLLLKF